MWHFQGILRCDMCARDVSARSRVCPVLEIWFDVSARAAIRRISAVQRHYNCN